MLSLIFVLAVHVLSGTYDPTLPACPRLVEELDTYANNVKTALAKTYPRGEIETKIAEIVCYERSLLATVYLQMIDGKRFYAVGAYVLIDMMPDNSIKIKVHNVKELTKS